MGVPFSCFWLRPKALADLLCNVDTIEILRAVDPGSQERTPIVITHITGNIDRCRQVLGVAGHLFP